MDLKLYSKIVDERIADPMQLDERERLLLKGDPQAVLALQENQALAELASVVPPPPARERLLAQAFSGTARSEDSPAAVRRGYAVSSRANWLARAVSVVALALVIALALNITPQNDANHPGLLNLSPAQPAWATKPGLLMECGTQTSDEGLAQEIAESVDARLRETIASRYADLQSFHVAMARERNDLQDHHAFFVSLHSDESRDPSRQAEAQRKLEEMKAMLDDHLAQLQETEIDQGRLLELAHEHLGILNSQLSTLETQLANIHQGEIQYLKRDISRNDEGNFVITLALPEIPLELGHVRDRLRELQEIENVHLENAVFFVRGEQTTRQGQDKAQATWEWQSAGSGGGDGLISKTIRLDAPEPEVVEAGIRRVLRFVEGAHDIDVELAGHNGHLAVVLQREGKLIDRLEGRQLGQGFVGYGLPEDGATEQLLLNRSIAAAQLHGELSGVVQEAVALGQGYETRTINEIRLVSGAEAGAAGVEREISVTVTGPGETTTDDLEGKIIAVLGDARQDASIEVITEWDGEIRVVRILVDGEEISVLRLLEGDAEVVVSRAGKQDSKQ